MNVLRLANRAAHLAASTAFGIQGAGHHRSRIFHPAQQEVNPTKGGRSGGQAGAQRTQNLVFPVTLQPESRTIYIDGVLAPLGADMAITAEMCTGDRRILEYVLSPPTQIASEAMRER
jgi:hypothetical protein